MYLFRRYFTETASAGDIPAAAAAADLGAPRGAQDGGHGTGGTGRCPRCWALGAAPCGTPHPALRGLHGLCEAPEPVPLVPVPHLCLSWFGCSSDFCQWSRCPFNCCYVVHPCVPVVVTLCITSSFEPAQP